MNRCGKKSLGTLGVLALIAIVSACGTAPSPPPVKPKHDLIGDQSGKVQLLQRQLRERDKRIAELEAQLEALKLIDQDYERQKRVLSPPEVQTPVQ